MADILGKLKSMITAGIQRKKADDSGDMGTAQVSAMGQTRDIASITPYGVANSPPKGSVWVIFQLRGNSDDCAGIGNDYKNRFKNLKEGEMAVYNSKSGTHIYLKEDGTIEIASAGNIDISGAPFVNVASGTVKVTGGDVLADTVSLKNHVHSGVTPGPSNTGAPVP